jgi:type I restriction enzyme S subunit
VSFPRYQHYKTSGIEWLGDVPDHWQVMPIRGAARLESGHTPSRNHPEYWENCSVPWFTLADVWQIRESGRNFVFETKEKVSELGLANSAARKLPTGTVMLSRTASVGFSAIMGVDMATSQDFANWVCGPMLEPKYLLHVFRSMSAEFERLKMGSTHNTIYMPDIQALRFALPPLDEQIAISAFIDCEVEKIGSLISEQQRLIDLLNEKRQAIISHAVTKGLNPDAPMKDSGIEWLGVVPAHWDVTRLKHVTRQITVGIVVEPSKHYVPKGVPALRSLNVSEGKITLEEMVFISPASNDLHAKSVLRMGDLVAVRSGQPGTTAVIPPDLDGCNCIDLLIIRKPHALDEWFLCWYLSSNAARHQFSLGSGGAIQQHFNVATARDLILPVPPGGEQQRLVAFVQRETDALDMLIDKAKRAIDLLNERRTALISAAVTGQIDVRGLAEAEVA